MSSRTTTEAPGETRSPSSKLTAVRNPATGASSSAFAGRSRNDPPTRSSVSTPASTAARPPRPSSQVSSVSVAS